MRNKLLIWLVLSALFFSCSEKKNKDESDNSEKGLETIDSDKCETIYIKDSVSGKFFKEFIFEDYNWITSSKMKKDITYDPIKNSFDSLKVDSIITIKSSDIFLKYYSRPNSKILLESKVSNKEIQVLKNCQIGMSFKSFEREIINKYFRADTKISKDTNCVCISTISEYDQLCFLFNNGELISVHYSTNVESFR